MDLVTLTFNLEISMQVASKVGHLPSKFGHTRHLVSRIICYVRNRQTDKWTNGQTTAMLIAPFLRAGA